MNRWARHLCVIHAVPRWRVCMEGENSLESLSNSAQKVRILVGHDHVPVGPGDLKIPDEYKRSLDQTRPGDLKIADEYKMRTRRLDCHRRIFYRCSCVKEDGGFNCTRMLVFRSTMSPQKTSPGEHAEYIADRKSEKLQVEKLRSMN
ncbi:hypothetical protein Bbelb_387610 [Branchiostoma belcheri]|nr:hypothetical protein Bbelb_387610 [Branchiostoma belcheri]